VRDLFPFIVAGVAAGSVYGLAGIGFTLTYKTAGIFNLAFGGLATLSAFVFYAMHVEHALPWPLAALIDVIGLGIVTGILLERLGRSLSRTTMYWRIGAFLGLQVTITAYLAVHFGTYSRIFPHFLPISTFDLAGVRITYEQLTMVGVSALAALGLFVFFRTTRMGTAMRAVVTNPELLDLAGTNPRRVRRWAWAIGCGFALLSGLLLAPYYSLDPYTLSLVVVQALGAAACGGFSNLALVWVGGIIIGVGSSLMSKWFPSGSIANVGLSLPVIVLFVVLIASPRVRPDNKDFSVLHRPNSWTAPLRVHVAMGAVVLCVLAFVPAFVAGYLVDQWALILANVLLLVSLGLLVKVAGQVSLCQVSFAALGAASFSQLTHGFGLRWLPGFHLPWLAALLLCGVVVVPIGALLSIPAMRISGLYLALTTFAFGLLQDQLYPVGGEVSPPKVMGFRIDTPTGIYYVVLVITTIAVVAVVVTTRTRFGRLLRGLADAPRALMVSGASVRMTVVLAFCISAYVAAISGALFGMVFGHFSELDFNPTTSILDLLVVMLFFGATPWYALFGAFTLGLVPIYFSTSVNSAYYLQIIIGGGVIVAAMLNRQSRLLLLVQAVVEKLPGSSRPTGRRDADSTGPLPPSDLTGRRSSLEVRDVSVRFGGLLAVDNLSFDVRSGQIIGLIGPNGSGKTTALNVCSGLVRLSGGAVFLDGRNVSRLQPAVRAVEGLGRTFQRPELFESLTVEANVGLGCEARLAGRGIAARVIATRHDRRITSSSVEDALALCGLQHLTTAYVAALSSGQRRFVELARCLAGNYRILLLDEPSTGLDRAERQRFIEILRRITNERGVGVVLVEHDMELVMTVCQEIYAISFGKLICHGPPKAVQADRAVAEAYLGTQWTTSL
jgi:ABC-type branched-subunit amino acid transport system ATPase component/branched-subunit amino acid ABC-type transport system permease component